MTIASVRADPDRSSRFRVRRRLLLGCAFGAGAALGVQSEPARAQAFQATPTTVAGTVTYNRATPGVETVTLNSNTAIIDWTPTVGGNPIDFLPAGNTATFNRVGQDFVVLNRVLTTTPIQFNGTVQSQIISTITGPGGTILFSSPGGIIVGATAVFDVGSLVLTSLNVVDDGNGNFINPSGGFDLDNGGAVPGASVVTEPGAQIVASQPNSYVAMISPRVEHGGNVNVNGSAAYIAANQVSFAVNQGLFDIVVATGTQDANGVVHTGTTGGPASTGGTDNHRIYAVAVPQSQAIQMLLSGAMGFDPPISATIENGEIVIRAGYDTAGVSGASSTPASALIQSGTFTSNLFGDATGTMSASALGTSIRFDQDVDLHGDGRAEIVAGAGGTIDIAGRAVVDSSHAAAANPGDLTVVGGDALVSATGTGSISVGNGLSVNGDGRGETVVGGANAGQGGTAGILADGGTVAVTGDATVSARGYGAYSDPRSGDGTGGNAYVAAANGGSVTVTGAASVNAQGYGGFTGTYSYGPAGDGFGGTAALNADSGAITISGDLLVLAGGFGGPYSPISSSNRYYGATGASGTGGAAAIGASGSGTVDIQGATTVAAAGFGGGGAGMIDPADGGAGTGGTATVSTAGGQATFNGLSFDVNGVGGDGISGGAGGAGAGGDAVIDLAGGIVDTPTTDMQANGAGGAGTAPGNGAGGLVRIAVADGAQTGRATLGGTLIASSGFDGTGAQTAGDTAGRVVVADTNTVAAGLSFADLSVNATGGTPSSAGPAFDFSSDQGPVQATGSVVVSTTGDMRFATANSGGFVATGFFAAVTPGTIAMTHAGVDGPPTTGGSSVTLAGGVAITGDAASLIAANGAAGDVLLNAPTIDVGTVTSNRDVRANATTLGVQSATAGRDIQLTSTGDTAIVFARALGDFTADAGGTFTGGTVIANGTTNITINAGGDLRLDNGLASGTIDLNSNTGSILSDGTLQALQLNANAALDLALHDVIVANNLLLTTTGGNISGNSFTSDGDIRLDSAGSITLANAAAESDVDLVSVGDIVLGTADADDDFTANSGGTFTADAIEAGGGTDSEAGSGPLAGAGNIAIVSAGDLRLDFGQAGQAMRLTSNGGSVLSDGLLEAATTLDAQAAIDVDISGSEVNLTSATAGRDVLLDSAGDLSIGTANAVRNFAATPRGTEPSARSAPPISPSISAGRRISRASRRRPTSSLARPTSI